MGTVSAAALAGHPFFRGMPEPHLAPLAGAASLVTVPAGYRFFEVGGMARNFWLIRAGQVALDVLAPGNGRIVVEVLGRGEVLGLSWFLPPFRWEFGAVSRLPTEAFELDGQAVRRRCEQDPRFGYQFTSRLMAIAVRRLQATRVRLLDVRGARAGV